MSAYSSAVLADAPLSYWRLDEASGTSAADAGSAGNTGTYQGAVTLNQAPAFAVGGASASFPGSSAAYVLGKAGALAGGLTDFSIELWFRTSGNAGILALYSERVSAVANDLVLLRLDATTGGGQPRFLFRDDAGNLTQLAQSAVYAFRDDVWYHLVLTKANRAAVLYLDGIAVATATLAGNDAYTNAGIEARIGGDKADGTIPFQGYLDEVAVYGTALTEARARAHYLAAFTAPSAPADNYGRAVFSEPSLAGWWRLNETAGTAAADYLGRCPGTYTGGYTLNQTPAPGVVPGPALALDGSTGHVNLGAAPGVNFPAPWTVEAWIKPTAVNVFQAVASHGNDGWYLRLSSAGKLQLLRSRVALLLTGATTLTAGQWAHVAGTYDGSGNLALYLNGVPDATGTSAVTIKATAPAAIGVDTAIDGTHAEWFGGQVAEVAVYSEALGATRIAAHAAGTPPAVAAWPAILLA
jgi:trimeric autotransporter adhesin